MPSTYGMAKSYANKASLQILVGLLIASLAQSTILTTELTLYVHEFFTGPNKTAYPVVGLVSPPAFGYFGTIAIVDNLVTEGISVDSTQVGRFQGLGAAASLDNLNAEGLTSLLFTNAEYNGSTLELHGLTLPDQVKEYPIVGGTKQFRYATGYVLFEILSRTDDYLVAEFYFHINQDLRLLNQGNRKKASWYSKYVSF